MLSMGRSGTNWLNSISNATGEMGVGGEWLGFEKLEKPARSYSDQGYFDHVMQKASTENGRFTIKIFPRHLRRCQARFGFDFIQKCAAEHDVKLVLIQRKDRVRQAISALKATQNRSWTDKGLPPTAEQSSRLHYNFRALCRLYFSIGQEFEFWRSYLGIYGYDYESYYYEDLIKDPSPYFESLAKHLSVAPVQTFQSPLNIQRNQQTEVWAERFEQDIKTHGLHPDAYALAQPEANVSNAVRVLTGRPIFAAPKRRI